MEQEKFYIATSIPYANNVPHVGHAYEAIISDTIARFRRSEKKNVFFLTGTDEHGSKIAKAAKKEAMGPQAFVDRTTGAFEQMFRSLNISYDYFIRTSDEKNHWPGATLLWNKLVEAGDIYKEKYQGLYCIGCEAFVLEGDLDEKGNCPHHGAAPQPVEEENYFFRLSKYTEVIREKIEKDELSILPLSRKNEVLAFLNRGLDDVSFSRPEESIPWGIPVPGDSSQVMYVWCDALSNYLSGLGYGTEHDEKFQSLWPTDLHVIGKDILRFHALIWPGMLFSVGLPLPKRILVHGFINSGGRKMSKTIGNVIDPNEYIEAYGADALRAYLAGELSPFEDGDFTKEKFVDYYNATLANGFGNLLSRTVKMALTYFDGIVHEQVDQSVPFKRKIGAFEGVMSVDDFPVVHTVHTVTFPEYKKYMNQYELNRAFEVLRDFSKMLDSYITDYEPFKLINTDKKKTEAVIWNCLYGLYGLGELLYPFLPDTAEKIQRTIGAELAEGDPVKIPRFSVQILEKPLFVRKSGH